MTLSAQGKNREENEKLLTRAEDFFLHRCGAGPSRVDRPTTELLNHFFKKGTPALWGERIAIACPCLLQSESIEVSRDVSKEQPTTTIVSVVVRGMMGKDLRDRIDRVILPAIHECLSCSPLSDLCIPLRTFRALAEQSKVWVVMMSLDGEDDVESAFVVGSEKARGQLCADTQLLVKFRGNALSTESGDNVAPLPLPRPHKVRQNNPYAKPEPQQHHR